MRVEDKAKASGDGAPKPGVAADAPGGSLRMEALRLANGDERKAAALLQKMLQKKGIPAGGGGGGAAQAQGASGGGGAQPVASGGGGSGGRPGSLHAQAYAQGSDIHTAPGQEEHLPHEAWHVVQQGAGQPTLETIAQGPAKAIVEAPNPPVSDVDALEREADAMGMKAMKSGGGGGGGGPEA